EFTPTYLAGGALVDRSDLVLTLFHAIKNARKLYVITADGQRSYADIQAADPRSDWAVLKLLTSPTGVLPLALGQADGLIKGVGVRGLEPPRPATRAATECAVSWSHLARRYRQPDASVAAGLDAAPPTYFGAVLQTDGRSLSDVSGGGLANERGQLVALTSK